VLNRARKHGAAERSHHRRSSGGSTIAGPLDHHWAIWATVYDERPYRLELAFEARGATGSVSVDVRTNTEPASIGCAPEAAGFPVCEATVATTLQGYNALLGWVQLVGTESPSRPRRGFEVDPLELVEGFDMPFCFYGLEPRFFDAPSRRDRQQTLDWLAHSFLCVSATEPMDRVIQPVASFQWGFRMRGGDVGIVAPKPLPPSTWTRHKGLLRRVFPSWRFEGSPGA
jgi:hypothetical protein